MILLNSFDNPSKALEGFIKDLEVSFKINITVHDMLGLLKLPDGTPLLPERHIHHNPYCLMGRWVNRLWENKCVNHCMFYIEKKVSEYKQPFVHSCWKGISEVVAPIIRENLVIGCIYAGGFKTKDYISQTGDMPEIMDEFYKDLDELDEKRITSLKRLCIMLGIAILSVAESVDKASEETGRRQQILKFVSLNSHAPIKISRLASELYLSESRTIHLVKELFNKSFSELVTEERIERAKVMLLQNDNPLEQIATACGFSNSHYFNRVFRRQTGIPPGKFRKQHQHN